MKTFEHSALTSPFFRLAEVVEVDVLLGDDSWSWRMEVFQAVGREDLFRYRAWELELFRLQPTFPQDEAGDPLHLSDDALLVNRPLPLALTGSDSFTTGSVAEAVDVALEDLRRTLEHVIKDRDSEYSVEEP